MSWLLGGRRRRVVLLVLVLVLGAGALGVVFWSALFEDNLRVVIPGEVYRSGQMEADDLAETIKALKIRRVINLRQFSPDDVWYHDEVAVCERLGVEHQTISLKSTSLPSPVRLLELIEALKPGGQRPLLIHCQFGSDRAGLASALLMIVEGRGLEAARSQLSIRYGHLAFTDAGVQGALFDDYEAWLGETGKAVGTESLVEWIKTDYDFEMFHAFVSIDDFPATVRRGAPVELMIWVKNQSISDWFCDADRNLEGHVNLRAWIVRADGSEREELPTIPFKKRIVYRMTTWTVPWTLAVDRPPGAYRLEIDLNQNQRSRFSELTGRLTTLPFTVTP